MRALIIEDEAIAAKSLIKTLEENFEDISVVGLTTSIAESVAWLNNSANAADIIFMDVELSDGKCFEIFKRAKINAHVIMTTAYDQYAIKAFEVNSIDYLLKPVVLPALTRAVERCRHSSGNVDISRIIGTLAEQQPEKVYKERHLVYLNDRIVPIKASDVLYFFSESKNNHVVTKDGTIYIVDKSLDSIMDEVDPKAFFKISRGCIVAKETVESVTKIFGGRLAIVLNGKDAAMTKRISSTYPIDLTVSRARVEDFLRWLEN